MYKRQALGTNRFLYVYSGGAFYDITPLDSALTGADFDATLNDPTVTVNKASHGFDVGDLFTFTSVTVPTGSGYTTGAFEDQTFQVVTVPTIDTFTITMATDSGATTAGTGSATLNPYIKVGPLNQSYGYGFGTSGWGGSSGVLGSGWDLTLEASSDLTGVDGLTLYGGISQVEQYQNASTYDGDVKETVYGFKYAVGGFTFGAQTSDEDTGATATASYDNIAYGITFQISDDLAVSYGHTESDNGATTAEADSLQASYTMGGATISIAEVEVNNATYSTASTADKDATIISLGLAF